MRRPVLPTSASALFYTKVCFIYLRYALTFLLGMSGRRHLRRPLCLCAWTQQGVSFHPLWSLCLMFLLRACVPQRCKVFFKITNLLCEWHAGFCGGYFSPSACKKQKSLVHPLSPCYLVYLRYTKRCDDLFCFGMYSVSRDGDI